MIKLDEIKEGSLVKGIKQNGEVKITKVEWHGDSALTVTFRDIAGQVGEQIVFRDMENQLEIVEQGRPWSFDADALLLRLVSEAYRIRMAYLFDPHLAVHSSIVDPLPHQLTAVYESMMPRQPLRFLLADDPGAGKTIMAGLFIKELMVRGDLDKCLIICPGNLVDQWQDELYQKFKLPFDIITNESIESSRTGNPFIEKPYAIARLDKLSRDEEFHAKIAQIDWDLIICDEAHKMSASFFGSEVKETKRYKLGKLLSNLTRHFLLMTATPHNGKEEDFQLFMALLDGDRFEGRFKDGVHVADTSDMMRRMVKEQLKKFDGKPLFPERKAYTVQYELSDEEAFLYEQVTNYVKEEFNRAESLENDGRKGTVGFALTILQRRLASSPKAIAKSLENRRKRLEKRLNEEELLRRGASLQGKLPVLTEEDFEDFEDKPDSEVEDVEEAIVDQATAAQTIEELKAEIEILKGLEKIAHRVLASGKDKKWEELSKILQDNPEMFDVNNLRRKLIIFTEHRDTLFYLEKRIKDLLGRDEAVVTIQGSMGREERKKAEERFKQDKDVQILVATDAAGEGINLQRSHLMINYDLPWNPNRLEQRFGRIHRIGQTEVCHLWNLVAYETREGDVYKTLLDKLDTERIALGGAVFDVLGKAITGADLRKLMIDAIRYGDRPEKRAELTKAIQDALDHTRLVELFEEHALAHDTLDSSKVRKIREEMERYEARRLQPHFIASFFIEAFKNLGGSIKERETGRYEITNVPSSIISRDRQIGTREPVLKKYERISFEKDKISVQGKPLAAFVCPGHPLLNATIDIILERNRGLLRQGAIFVNENDPGEDIKTLFYLEHSVHDGRSNKDGQSRAISKQMQFVEIDIAGKTRNAGYAPYLDYRPLEESEKKYILPILEKDWKGLDLDSKAMTYAIINIAKPHTDEVKARTEDRVKKTMAAVHDRLVKEITYWDHRSQELRAEELTGKVNARLNSGKAKARADELTTRLQKRMEELEKERQISSLPPVIVGGALVIPGGLLNKLDPEKEKKPDTFAKETKEIELNAMSAVIEKEKSLGFIPRDVSKDNLGYDIESSIPETGKLRFIEVKGRITGATTVTITKNEILTAFNKPDDYILALVEVVSEPSNTKTKISYLKKPFSAEPDFSVTSVNYDIKKLIKQAETIND